MGMSYDRRNVHAFWEMVVLIAALVGVAMLIWQNPMESLAVLGVAMVTTVAIFLIAAINIYWRDRQHTSPPVAH